MPGDDLFAEGHGTRLGRGRRERDFSLEPGDVEVEQAAVLDDAAGDLALAGGECVERDRLATPHLVEDPEVGRREHAEVLAVLAVDALDVFRHHELDSRTHFGVRRLLPRRALPPSFAADGGHEAPSLHRPARDGERVAALEAEVRKVTQGFVVVVTDVCGSDFVGGDVVAELDRGSPVEVLPLELLPDQPSVLGQEQDSTLELHLIWQFRDATGA